VAKKSNEAIRNEQNKPFGSEGAQCFVKKNQHIIHFAAFEPTICTLQAKKFHPYKQTIHKWTMKVPNLFANISKLKTLLFSCYYHSGLCL
jgi:hypothetical protein